MGEPGKEYLIRFDPEKCTQCHGCEIACKSWRQLPYGIHYRQVINRWNGGYPGVKSTTLSLACLHCVEPACAQVCPEEAIAKNDSDGRVLVDVTRCIGCKACVKACPFGVPQIGEEKVMAKCDLCLDQPLADADPPCVGTCPGKALTLVAVTSEKKTAVEDATRKILS